MREGMRFELTDAELAGCVDMVENYFGIDINPKEMEKCHIVLDLARLISKEINLS
jgi:acyl carrier protein